MPVKAVSARLAQTFASGARGTKLATSIKDIARVCGVSAPTVSRALRGKEGVSEAKRREIRGAAEQMNYVANASARSLVMARSDLVGVSVPTLFNDVFASMIDGLRRGLAKAGISMVIHSTDYDPDEETKWIERLMSWRPAGIVLTGTDHHRRLRQIVRNSGIPTAEIWDVASDPIDFCVGIDHRKAGRLMAEHALDLGYVRPGFVLAPAGHDPRADKRFAGALDRFREVGLAEAAVTSESIRKNNFSWGYAGALQLCRSPKRPDVLFFVNDHLAVGGLSACEVLGLDVPGDIGVIGFNDMDVGAVLSRKLTTVRTPRSRMGRLAAQHLIARLNGVDVPRVSELVPTLRSGQTTRRQ